MSRIFDKNFIIDLKKQIKLNYLFTQFIQVFQVEEIL